MSVWECLEWIIFHIFSAPSYMCVLCVILRFSDYPSVFWRTEFKHDCVDDLFIYLCI